MQNDFASWQNILIFPQFYGKKVVESKVLLKQA
jgi:hypothetical protein